MALFSCVANDTSPPPSFPLSSSCVTAAGRYRHFAERPRKVVWDSRFFNVDLCTYICIPQNIINSSMRFRHCNYSLFAYKEASKFTKGLTVLHKSIILHFVNSTGYIFPNCSCLFPRRVSYFQICKFKHDWFEDEWGNSEAGKINP